MEDPRNAPTTADYAMSAARNVQAETDNLWGAIRKLQGEVASLAREQAETRASLERLRDHARERGWFIAKRP